MTKFSVGLVNYSNFEVFMDFKFRLFPFYSIPEIDFLFWFLLKPPLKLLDLRVLRYFYLLYSLKVFIFDESLKFVGLKILFMCPKFSYYFSSFLVSESKTKDFGVKYTLSGDFIWFSSSKMFCSHMS